MTAGGSTGVGARALETAEKLLAAVTANGMVISGDQRVSEADAARLVGLQAASLRNLRAEGAAPPSYRVPVGGQRISYRIFDLAQWIEARRDDF